MPDTRALVIPVVLGPSAEMGATVRAARFVYQRLRCREGVRTRLTDADGFASLPEPADAVVVVRDALVAGHGGSVEDGVTGVVAVSARRSAVAPAVETSLAILRELGQVTIFWDVNLESAGLLEEAVVRGTDKFLAEVMRMAMVRRRAPRRTRLAGFAEPAQDTA